MIHQPTNRFTLSDANVFPDATSILGEGPVWHHEEEVSVLNYSSQKNRKANKFVSLSE